MLFQDNCCSRSREPLIHFTPYGQYKLISDNNYFYSFSLAALEGLSGSLHVSKLSLINVPLASKLAL